MITFSAPAIQEVHRLRQSQAQPEAIVRLTVLEQGCAGLSYSLTLEKDTHSSDDVYPLAGFTLAVDRASVGYLEGVSIDYAEDLMGGNFRFQNAAAVRNCDCGISFAVKPL